MTYDQLSAVTGLRERHLYQIRTGEYERVRRDTAAKVLAATFTSPDPRPSTALVPARGATRRVQALHTLGHTTSTIATTAGIHPRVVTSLTHPSTRFIQRRNADAITHAYDQLQGTPGGDDRWANAARNRAARNQWAPPAAWDDIDNDPAPQDWQEPAPTGQGAHAPTWHVEDAQFLADLGHTVETTAARLGLRPASLRTSLRRAGHHHLLDQLHDNAHRAELARHAA